jgi:phage tail-like protein
LTVERRRIARYLPETYQAAVRPDNPLGALLAVMESLHAPADAALDNLDAYVDPHRAPDPFVVMLAEWMDLDRYLEWSGGRPGVGTGRFPAGLPRLRLLIAEAAELARNRGTKAALERFLAVGTGVAGIAVEENPPGPDGAPRPFHLLVRAPAAARRLQALVRQIVDEERPAHATYEVAFESD